MASTLSPITASRLEKAAVDNGFDLEQPSSGNWLGFASSQCSLRLWLGVHESGPLVVGFSRENVVPALETLGKPAHADLPPGCAAACQVQDIPKLHRLLRRAFQLGKSLPDELLHVFQARTSGLPRSTEAERLVVQRVGQDVFRQGLMEYWEGRCAITGLAIPELLRASHIKPWAACATDAERLDVYNGLLLAPHLDALFDQGFITVANDGKLIISTVLTPAARTTLGVTELGSRRVLITGHRAYLAWHQERVFKKR
ncbi:MAG: HNH endonuclease [Limisphaerales bacterium]